jgi:trimeric autotransporter adhesin
MKTRGISLWLILTSFFLIASGFVFAFQPANDKSDLRQKEFFIPEMYIGNRAASYSEVNSMLPNKNAIDAFAAKYKAGVINFDPRSGFPMSITASIPLIPGNGIGNHIKLMKEVDAKLVAEAFRNYVIKNREALGINVKQLGAVKATKVTDRLWHVNIPQQVNGVPVRWGHFTAVINSGNIILQGAATWGNVNIDTNPNISAAQAMDLGFQYAGGKLSQDLIWKQPALEIIPISPNNFSIENFAGQVGSGYGHRLAWVFGFQRAPENPRWEVVVDAHTSEVIAFEDKNHYIDKQITGGAYPFTNTEICPDNIRCGILQPGTPMPFANTGFAPPNDFTNSAGVFNYNSGTTTTTLQGPYVTMTDTCGTISATGSGDIDMGGANGDHDCTTPTSGGNTAATRSGMYEVNKIFEEARGWLPNNQWLNGNDPGPLVTNMNIALTCNAFYNGEINFYKEGGGCRNTGEIAAIFDHEWGHGMDDHDEGPFSNSSEGYADIASMFRLWASCVGYGFFESGSSGCGTTSDGTGPNQDEAQVGPAVCDLDCSGVRDADYLKIANGTPLGAAFMCASCGSGGGPCGRQVHCAGTATREAAWNLAARELQNPPGVSVDANTAFMIAEKVFYQGSGNVGLWHNCTCPTSSDGCNADGGYLNWIAADDDDGDLTNGTPHMEDIFAAFNTNGIACPNPAPTNSGCSGDPTEAPTLSGSGASSSITLDWTSVPGAVNYNVFRTEGYVTDGTDKCAFGKAKVGTTSSLTFTDHEVANGRSYSYVVVAEGSNDACFGPASNCTTVQPQACAGAVSIDKTAYNCTDVVNILVSDSDLIGAGTQDVIVTAGSDTETVTLNENPPSSGTFGGSINTSGSGGSSGDGTLNIVDGDTITVTYSDQSFCGPQQDVTVTADADCVVPAISNVQSTNVFDTSATITWDTNENANSRVTYAVAPGPPSTNVDDLLNYVTAHSIQLTGLNACTDYVYSVSSADPAGNSVTDDNSGTFYTFTTISNTAVFTDDAESGLGNWVTGGGPSNNQWHQSACQSQSPTHAFKAGPTGCSSQYSNNVSVTLTSVNGYDIVAGSRLEYAENYNTESGFDFCTPQISTDGGSTWQPLDSYAGNSGGWIHKSYDLTPYAGTGRKIRFQFESDGGVTATGWYVDDITVLNPAACGAACAYSQDFNDTTQEWIEEKPAVTQPGDGFLHLSPTKKKAIAAADSSFAGASNGTYKFDVQFTGGVDAKNWLYITRVDKKNALEILLKVDGGKVVVKDKNQSVLAKEKGLFTFTPNTPYQVVIVYNGTTVDISINGTPVITGFTPTRTLPTANIGGAAKNNDLLIDNVCVN